MAEDSLYDEQGEAEDKQHMVQGIMKELGKLLAPKYRIVDTDKIVQVDPVHILAGITIECVDGPGDEEELDQLVNSVLAERPDLINPLVRTWTVEEGSAEPDDLLAPFSTITMSAPNPEADAFEENLFEQYVMAINVVGLRFKELVDMCKSFGLSQEQGSNLCHVLVQTYVGGADTHAYTVSQLQQWDADHPDGPSALAISMRAYERLSHNLNDPVASELLHDRLDIQHADKHHWRYHNHNLVQIDRDLFDSIWEDEDQ